LKRHPYRIVLADDHTIVRRGVKKMIEEMADLKVIGEASDGQELLSLLKILDTDLVILDISMPNLRGIEATRELKKVFPDVKVLILTMYRDKELLHHAISSGADGYLLKEDSDKELYTAIEKVRHGKPYISPRLSERLTDDREETKRGIFKPPLEDLTKREIEVLRLIAEGKSSKEIADLLFISVRTVENHRARIMSKLDMRNTAELVKYAIHRGYIS
jgi:DNA-binding NarL/FixJ family response regulator